MPNFIVQTLRQIMERRGFQIEDGGVMRLNLNPTDAARAWEIEEGEEWAAWAAEEEQGGPEELGFELRPDWGWNFFLVC